MDLGIYLYSQSRFDPNKDFETLVSQTKQFENDGFSTIWVSDELTNSLDTSIYTHYETNVLLTALSQQTSKINFGSMVSPYFFRNVGLHAKMMTTMDHLSKGRIICGLGIGDPSSERTPYGYNSGSVAHRMKEIEQYIIVLKKLFSGETVDNPMLGLKGADLNPLPYSDSLPILLAGGGENKTLKYVAKYCQMSNFSGHIEGVRHKLGVLERWCDEFGTNFSNLSKTMSRAIVTGKDVEGLELDLNRYFDRSETLRGIRPSVEAFSRNRFVGTLEEVGEQFDRFKEIGIDHITLTINTPGTRELGSEIVKLTNS